MKKTMVSLTFLVFLSSIGLTQTTTTFIDLWNSVQKNEARGLNKSALSQVDLVYKKAKKEGNQIQLIKSLIYKSKFVQILEENSQLKIISELKFEIENSVAPAKNVLEYIIAYSYWQYYQQNRYRFYRRSHTDQKVDEDDFRTWDLQNIFLEIHDHYQNALQDSDVTQSVDLKEFNEILLEKKDSKIYRPTLYDFLAHSALDFYKNDDVNLSRPAYKFELTDPELFASNKKFVNMSLGDKDSLSQRLHALYIYKSLTEFHINDSRGEALVMLTLQRLEFVRSHGVFSNKEDLYYTALLDLEKEFEARSIQSEIMYERASFFDDLTEVYSFPDHVTNRWKTKEALELCQLVIKKYLNSSGAQKCKLFQSNILLKSLTIQIEKFIPKDTESKMLVKYRNVDELYITAYEIPIEDQYEFRSMYNDSLRIAHINKLNIHKSWKVNLRDEGDYLEHSSEVIIPALSHGSYMIVASLKPKLEINDLFGFEYIQVTDIVLVTDRYKNKHIYQILNRVTGKPIQYATIYFTNKGRPAVSHDFNLKLTTDHNGQAFFYPRDFYENVEIQVNYKNDMAVFGGQYISQYRGYDENEIDDADIFLFTDRSIYRPGQTVFFKGIAVAMKENESTLIVDEDVEISLSNVNGQEIKSMRLKLNEFGSLSGEFTLPADGLTGVYSIGADFENSDLYSVNGAIDISVEEYKRPKFRVEFESIKESYKLNDTIRAVGKSVSFAGSNVTEAEVSYKVVRTAHYPRWYNYYYRGGGGNLKEHEITHGKTTTDSTGSFEIAFVSIPDLSIDSSFQPTFTYEVSADVIDINGETRSEVTRINVGYHVLNVHINLDRNLEKNKENHIIKVSSSNLNGVVSSVKGTLSIYKLVSPDRVLRPRPWKTPDYPLFSNEEFVAHYPHEVFGNESDYKNWEKGDLVWQNIFDTDKKEETYLEDLSGWKAGKYLVAFECIDKFGQKVKDEQYVEIIEDGVVSDHQLFWIRTDKMSYQTDEELILSIGSAAENLSVNIVVEKNRNIHLDRVIHLSREVKEIRIPIREKDLGGFVIHYHFVKYNYFNSGSIPVFVPYPKHELEIETVTFRDKLRPNDEETWEFKINGKQGEAVASELLASMYDSSLDQFKHHDWSLDPFRYNYYFSYSQPRANQSFGQGSFRFFNQKYLSGTYQQQFDELNWFGFQFMNARAHNQYVSSIRFDYFERANEEGVISGVVTDDSGEALIGASLNIKGTSMGTITDLDGSYSMFAEPGDVIVVSFTGYSSSEIVIEEKKSVYHVQLGSGELLEEVVITGYSSVRRKKEISSSVVTMDMASGMPGSGQTLQGRTSGVQIEYSAEGDVSDQGADQPVSLDDVVVRRNLNETAFFFPHLRTDSVGNVSFTFTSPESLTSWKLQLLAHSSDLSTAIQSFTTVTQKELMVLPNPPRFFRETDRITFQTKIANLVDKELTGVCELRLFDALTLQPIDDLLNESTTSQSFTINSNGNASLSWNLKIPTSVQAIKYTVVAKADNFSDGEENILPVLSNRMLVTETMPMWIRSNQQKTFTLKKLKKNSSTTLQNHKLTLEVTSNPAWYAVQALPYLMEYPHECAEQTFSRYYANALGSHVVNSSPRIKEVFDQWSSSESLLSNLENNQELKSLVIQETPWLRDAQSDSEQKSRVALLFDLNKIANELESTTNKLSNLQSRDGGFPWFKGGHSNRYITQHVVAGFGHLDKLGVGRTDRKINRIINKAISYLDTKVTRDYQDILEEAKRKRIAAKTDSIGIILEKRYLDNHRTGRMHVHFMYTRSLHKGYSMRKELKEAIAFFRKQAYKYWLENNLYTKGMLALIAHRNGDEISADILAMLRENANYSEELGMYWKENQNSWYWYQAPIETQALMIEVFSEVAGDLETVDELKIWLLKHKQTNRWSTTKSTSEAIYALMLQGSDWLAESDLVEIKIGDRDIDPIQLEDSKVEAGTGYFKTSWLADDISPDMASVTLAKDTEGPAWGGLYWQYFEELDKITTAASPLQLSKKLFLKKNIDSDEVLSDLKSGVHLKVGDLVTVRIEIKVDRQMEFVHLKDMRAASFEPINVISSYKYQDGLGYYESTRDASTNFFFDRMNKGVYVFEYDVRVNNSGSFSNGISTIQCMYAPEFSSHSDGLRVKVE